MPTPSKQETREGAEPSPAFVEDWARRMASWCCDGHGEDVPEPCPDDEWECLDAEDYEHWRGFVRHLARALAAESRLPTMTGPLREALEHAYLCVLTRADGPLTPTAHAKYERTIAEMTALLQGSRALADNEDAGPTDARVPLSDVEHHARELHRVTGWPHATCEATVIRHMKAACPNGLTLVVGDPATTHKERTTGGDES